MPGEGRYGTIIAVKDRKFALGSADQTVLQKIYKHSVMATLSFKDLVDLAKKHLTADTTKGVQKGDATIWPSGEVNLNFVGAPNVAKEVTVGGGGLPSTAWSPNLNSPATSAAGGTINPADQTAMDPLAVPKPTGGEILGADGTLDPKAASAEVSSTLLGTSLPLGKHPGSK